MKITSIEIRPQNRWQPVSSDNPLCAKVSLSSEKTTVETVLNNEDCDDLIALIETIVARAAKRNVELFVASVSGGHAKMIEGDA